MGLFTFFNFVSRILVIMVANAPIFCLRRMLVAVVMTMSCCGGLCAATARDSVLAGKRTEMSGMMQREMLQSAYPVTITRRGNAVCVHSRHDQLLPVYKQGGAFYAAFRVRKGTNWLSGLPRGTYIINNTKVTVS